MTETITVAVIGLLGGIVLAVVPAYFAQRKNPSRKVADTATLVDAGGHVISTLREELDRYDRELDGARAELRACADEAKKLMGRIVGLEGALRGRGVDPSTIHPVL